MAPDAFPLTPEAEAEAASLRPAGPYACLHAGARDPERRWPAERFARVADWLAGEGIAPVLTGTAAERDVLDEVSARMRTQPRSAVGRTSRGGLAALLAGARVVVTNDGGAARLAQAVGAPTVVARPDAAYLVVLREVDALLGGEARELEPGAAVHDDV